MFTAKIKEILGHDGCLVKFTKMQAKILARTRPNHDKLVNAIKKANTDLHLHKAIGKRSKNCSKSCYQYGGRGHNKLYSAKTMRLTECVPLRGKRSTIFLFIIALTRSSVKRYQETFMKRNN